MLDIQSFSTDSEPPSRRLEFWNEVSSATLVDQVADPADPTTFSGRIRRVTVGASGVAEITASATKVIHSRAHISKSLEPVYLLRLPLAGQLTITQGNFETRLLPGDFAICDATQPYHLLIEQDISVLTVRVPRDGFMRYVTNPDAVTSRRMSGQSGASGITSRFLRDFWESVEDIPTGEMASRYADIALQLIASSYVALSRADFSPSISRTRHRIQILQYIENHLRDPQLTPRTVALALRLSVGYAHRLFGDARESMSKYILRRRLEECARALGDPLQHTRSITSIAFECGFNSMAHVSRVFKEHYGMSPREYRETRQGDGKAEKRPQLIGLCRGYGQARDRVRLGK